MNEYVIAKYIRLSVDDVITDSLSITNQHRILDRLIDEMEIPNATVIDFVDNGYTGTNMERPALQEMLELVRSGRIHCIVVKDFSRFSRNMAESGYYIEKVFPLYRIRFISISDRFDSKEDSGGIDVTFRFLMHEFYSQDLSRKVKSARRIKMVRGENIVANAIYGYRKNDAGKWEPEEISSSIVVMIYEMALAGMPPAIIKEMLCLAGYPTPSEHIEMLRGKDIIPKCLWENRAVLRILTNEQYIGTYVSGKQISKAIGSSSKILTDKSEWIIIPNSHPSIISKEIFERVQHLLENRLKSNRVVKPLGASWKDEENRPQRERLLNGDKIVATPIYGYSKTDDGQLEIDPIAAEVIRKIFALAKQGLSAADISAELSTTRNPSPREYISMGKGRDITPSCKWTAKAIRAILKNIQYTGAYVAGKILKDYNTGKSYHVPKEDWVVIPDKHPPIISKEIFDEVHEVITQKRVNRKKMIPRDYLLKGKVKCGICGFALAYDPIDDPVLRCYSTSANPSATCYKMRVVVRELDEAVLDIIRVHSEIVLDTIELSKLQKVNGDIQHTIDFAKQAQELTEQRQNLYEQYVMGEIDRDTYQAAKAECNAHIEKVNTQLALLKQAERNRLTGQETANLAKKALDETALPKDIVDTLIEKILVFPDDNLKIEWKVADFWVSDREEHVHG